MRTLTVAALVCAVMVLDRADAWISWTSHTRVVKVRVSCPLGWTRYSDRCFRYFRSPRTWARAERYCQWWGGNLASVHSSLEYRRVQSLIWRSAHRYEAAWIGGSDAQEERQWFWSDGSRFKYRNWCRGEPNNYRSRQHCLHINHGAGRCWDDLQCYSRAPFVCARKAVQLLG